MHEPSVYCRQVCEKYLANGKDIFRAFMVGEGRADRLARHTVADAKSMEFERNC